MWTRWSDLDRTFAMLDDFRRRMDRAFEGYGRRGAEPAWEQTAWPRLTLQDTGEKLMLLAEVPGLSDKDVELNLDQNVLTLAGRRQVRAPEGYSVHRQERESVDFSRSFTLPCKVDPEKVSATVKHGLLTVEMAKAPEAKPRQITVKAV